MPRGSRPGERRGGRQRGTPNKKTVLRNAAISAAAAGSNLSPLDLLLGLMREPKLPLELRISVAHEALPYVHSKQQDCDRPRARGKKYGARSHGVNAEPHPDSGPRVKTAKVSVAAPQRDDGPEVTPLGFLLGVMRDADTPLTFVSGWRPWWRPMFMLNAPWAIRARTPSKPWSSSMIPMALRSSPRSHGRFGMTSSGWFSGPRENITIETRMLKRWPGLRVASPKR